MSLIDRIRRAQIEAAERAVIDSLPAELRATPHDTAAQPVATLTDDDIDALDSFSLHWGAPRGRESVRLFARAVIAAAGRERTVPRSTAPMLTDELVEQALSAFLGGTRVSAAAKRDALPRMRAALTAAQPRPLADAERSEAARLRDLIDRERREIVAALHGEDVAAWRGYQAGDLGRLIALARQSGALPDAAREALEKARAALLLARPTQDDEPKVDAAIVAVSKALEALRAQLGEGA